MIAFMGMVEMLLASSDVQNTPNPTAVTISSNQSPSKAQNQFNTNTVVVDVT